MIVKCGRRRQSRILHDSRTSERKFTDSAKNVMVFGSSTDVGKTVISAGICRAALLRSRRVSYIKPIQTGEMDEYFIKLYTNPRGISDIFLRTLNYWQPGISPHLAAKSDTTKVSDLALVKNLRNEINEFSSNSASLPKRLFTVVETAGGVLSPGPNGTLQADIYRPIRLPVILVGDARLGGISSTLCAYESLRLRGYSIHAMALIDRSDSNNFGNATSIEEHFERCYKSIPGDNAEYSAWSLGQPPKIFSFSQLPSDRNSLLHAWFKSNEPQFLELFDHVDDAYSKEMASFEKMVGKGVDQVWWPYRQSRATETQPCSRNVNTAVNDSITFVESAHADHFKRIPISKDNSLEQHPHGHDKRKQLEYLFDGSSSWWTQVSSFPLINNHDM